MINSRASGVEHPPAAFPGHRLGIDWGSTHRRAYLLDKEGVLVDRHADDQGLLAIKGNFSASLAALLARWHLGADTEVLMAGMVGSRSGWLEAPYCAAPVAVADLGAQLVRVPFDGARVWVVPGVCDDAGPDVMRGEETQILGAWQLGGDACYLLPGTHSKWVHVRGGRIERLHTFMTGELFARLREVGTLASVLGQNADIAPAFAAGLQDSAQPTALSRQLFRLRAAVLRGQMNGDEALSRLSGLLIGSEWADPEIRALRQNSPIRVVGDPALAALHRRAAEHWGVEIEYVDPDAAFIAALHILFQAKEKSHG